MHELKHSKLVGKAILAVEKLEVRYGNMPWPDDESSDSDYDSDSSGREVIDDDDEVAEHALITYKYAIIRLGREYPSIPNPIDSWKNQQMMIANSMPCPCGSGRIGQWPWQLQTISRGFCACSHTYYERNEWMEASLGNGRFW